MIHRHTLKRLAFWIPLTACTVLALMPGPPAAGSVWTHIAAFLYLTPALWFAHFTAQDWSAVVVWMLLYGLGLELVQDLLPVRVADVWDLGSNAIGIVLGVGAYRIYGRLWST